MKTNKHQTLSLVKNRNGVQARDLVAQFGYSPGTARSYLSYLGRQDLLQRMGAGHVLTEKGLDRLHYFEVTGCADPACPLCQGRSGFFSCPRCDYRMPKKEARILQERDFLVAVRHAGVYCPRCLNLILTETQAQVIGIRKEA
jgi:tRNA(Ile2) C34 agmatinyltransferase TiaS